MLFTNLDRQILLAHTRVAHWSQVRFDRDNFWLAQVLARVGMMISIIYQLMFSLLLFPDPDAPGNEAYWMYLIIVLTAVTAELLLVPTARRIRVRTYEAVSRGCKNPLEPNVQFRFFLLAWFTLSSVTIPTLLVFGIVVVLWAYLVSVTPLEPHEVTKRRSAREARLYGARAQRSAAD